MEPDIYYPQETMSVKVTMFTAEGGYQLHHAGLWMALFSKVVAQDSKYDLSRYNNVVAKDRIELRDESGLPLAIITRKPGAVLWSAYSISEDLLRKTEELYATVAGDLKL